MPNYEREKYDFWYNFLTFTKTIADQLILVKRQNKPKLIYLEPLCNLDRLKEWAVLITRPGLAGRGYNHPLTENGGVHV